ncbi:MAG: universal stress protein [Casimicrobium sp.]
MHILLAVDGSSYSKHMLAYIAAHDELLGAGHEFTAITSVIAVTPNATHFLDRSALDSYYHDEAEKVFHPIREFAAQRQWKLTTHQAKGNAVDAIIAFVDSEKPDLIVMGTHGHSSLLNVVLGSVTTGVLSRCKVPVLLIR